MYVRKARAGSTPEHTWPHDGAVVEVPDHVGVDLLGIPDGGFTEVNPGSVDQPDAGDSAAVKFAGLARLAVVAEMVTFRDEIRQLIADEVAAAMSAHNPTPEGTAAPAGAGPSGGPTAPPGDGPAAAGPPDGAPNTSNGGKRPPGRK